MHLLQVGLQAVGLADSPRTVKKQASGSSSTKVNRKLAEAEEPLIPDLISVAAATEKTIIAVEEKAKRLGQMQSPEACSLLADWIQGLKRRPRTDEPLASFKASFLRSNSLEKSLENLRQNKSIQSYLAPDMTNLLQLCMPKGATVLAKPLLHAVVGEEVPLECATALLIAIQMLKEDWQEVVWSQVIRILERQLNSIEYELGKAKVHNVEVSGSSELAADRIPVTEHEQELSRDRVAITASLCEVISKSRHQAQSRAKQVSSALKQLGVHLSRLLGRSPRDRNLLLTPARAQDETGSRTPSPESDMNDNTEVAMCNTPDTGFNSKAFQPTVLECKLAAVSDEDSNLPATDESEARGSLAHEPLLVDYELAFESMMGKDTEGMRKGLQFLGFPDLPLQYEPGVELRLDGHDIRDVINRMLAHWSVGEVDQFNEALAEVRQIVGGADSSSTPLSLSPHDKKQEHDTSIEATEAASEMPVDEDHQCRFYGSSPGFMAERRECATTPCVPLASVDVPRLLAERADLVEERQVLIEQLQKDLERLHALDKKLLDVDASLGQQVPWELKHSESRGVAEKIASELAQSLATSVTLRERTWSTPTPSIPPENSVLSAPTTESASFMTPRAPSNSMNELLDLLDSVSAALELDSWRFVERLTTSLQQRRAKLLEALDGFFAGGAKLVEWATRDSAVKGGESMENLWSDAQELCMLVEDAVDGRSSHARISLHSPEIGARCRAKWAGDGRLYDATVQNIGEDGRVIVNWLRPRPDSIDTSPSKKLPSRPMITVSESGGDDSCYRWVAQEDVCVLEACEPTNVRAVQLFVDARSSEDRQCVDCGACDAQWACISYATFMCESCITAVYKGANVKFVLRSTTDIWGWSEEDLTYMRCGRNSDFLAALSNYPDIMNAPNARYTSRFSEYYRRRIEALAQKLPAPQPPSVETALMEAKQFPKQTPDLLCGPEARMHLFDVSHNFQSWACEARRKLPKPPPKSSTERLSTKGGYPTTRHGRQPLVIEGCGSVAARASYMDRKSI